MGFVLSIFYLVTVHLGAGAVLGPLAPYHIELLLAILILFVSLPMLARSFVLNTAQPLALIGLAFAGFLSTLIEVRWAKGAVLTFLGLLPSIFAYFIVCLHCNTRKKLRILVLMLMFVCLFTIVNGLLELRHPPQVSIGALEQSGERGDGNGPSRISSEMEAPYLFAMRSDAGVWFYRLRGQGFFNDPNDFGQLVVCVIPLVFIFWRSGKILQNMALVILPTFGLSVGLYLTHSRGALTALIAMAILAARRRIGTVPAMVVAAGLFAAAMSLHFTGGRDISAAAGEDRTALWGEGMAVLKTHPLFGVGFNNLPEYTDGHLTAHNSVVVCAAELGMFGLYFWSMFLFTTFRDTLTIASPMKVSDGEPTVLEEEPFPQTAVKLEEIDAAEINRLGRLMLLSLTGFLVAGWFLSRAFVVTLFMLGGMAEVLYEMALRRQMIAPRMQTARVLLYSGGLAIALLVLMYILVRILNLIH